MITQQEKNQIIEDEMRQEYQNDCFIFYSTLINTLKKSREGTGYLSLEDISRAIKESLGEDTKFLIKELQK